ncbi:MAG TPA: hypothetical protein VKC54_00175 [Patescibacteria group bacterium]|nr:hypothetical protein [Patescibacteria group bacterium]
MMTGKEKLYFLLDTLVDARDITSVDKPLRIDPSNDLNRRLQDVELTQLFFKLQNDERILNVLKVPNRTKSIDIVEDLDPYAHADDGCWHVKLTSAFDDFFLKIQRQPEYQEFTGKVPPAKIKKQLTRKSLEKIWTLLQEIEDKRGITSAEDEIGIQQVHYSKLKNMGQADGASDERLNILRKLENEDYAIKDVRWPHDHTQLAYFKITDKYFDVYDYYKSEYEAVASNYQKSLVNENNDETKPVYEVKYLEQTREISINGFLFKTLRSFSENDAIFAYLYKNPNKDVSDEDIKTGTGNQNVKDLNKFLENTGFIGDFRKVFFKASKSKIRFNNPITKEQLSELGIKHLSFD